MVEGEEVSELVHEAAGYTIKRGADGEWSLTPPPTAYGYDTVEEMAANEGWAPEAEPLAEACYSYPSGMAAIIQSLCEQWEDDRIERSWD